MSEYQDDYLNLNRACSASKPTVSTAQPSASASSCADSEQREDDLYTIVEKAVVELLDTGVPTCGAIVAGYILQARPELNGQYRFMEVESAADEILHWEVTEKSERLQHLFDDYNASYFGGTLPSYCTRAVYSVDHAARYPTDALCRSTRGLIRLEKRTIYIRVTDQAEMLDVLIHHMCHAATGHEHDAVWLSEMKRVYELGAPVQPSIFTKEGWCRGSGVQEMIDGMHELEQRAGELGHKGQTASGTMRTPWLK